MKRTYFAILVASTLFVGFAQVLSASPTPQPSQRGIEAGSREPAPKQNKSGQQERGSGTTTPAVDIAPLVAPSRPAQEASAAPSGNQTEKGEPNTISEERFRFESLKLSRKIIWLTTVLAAVNGVEVFLFLFTMLATVRAANAAKESANTARKSLEISQRAQVSIESVNLSRGCQWINYELRNSGSLPATKVTVRHFIGTKPDIAMPTRWKLQMSYAEPEPPGFSLAPNEISAERYPSLRNVKDSADVKDSAFDLAGLEESVREHVERALTLDNKLYLQFGVSVAYFDGFEQKRTSWVWLVYDLAIGEFRRFASRQD